MVLIPTVTDQGRQDSINDPARVYFFGVVPPAMEPKRPGGGLWPLGSTRPYYLGRVPDVAGRISSLPLAYLAHLRDSYELCFRSASPSSKLRSAPRAERAATETSISM